METKMQSLQQYYNCTAHQVGLLPSYWLTISLLGDSSEITRVREDIV